MYQSEEDAFAYWERTWTDVPPGGVGVVDVLGRARELVNDEWSEAEAARELASLAAYDELRDTHIRLLAALLRTPFVDIPGIRVSRVIWAALDVSARGVLVQDAAEPFHEAE